MSSISPTQTTHQVKYSAIYKVYFQGNKITQTEDTSLTFFGQEGQLIEIHDFPQFLLLYNELARKKQVKSIKNIREVIALGQGDKTRITSYIIVLYSQFTKDHTWEKRGLLIGNHKVQGYIILGIWPFNITKSISSSDMKYNELLKAIGESPETFKDLIVIT